jgi:hypothetical protein
LAGVQGRICPSRPSSRRGTREYGPDSPGAAPHRRVRRPRAGGAEPDPRWTGPRAPTQTRIRPARSAPGTAGARRPPRSTVTMAGGRITRRPALPPAKDTKPCSTDQGPARRIRQVHPARPCRPSQGSATYPEGDFSAQAEIDMAVFLVLHCPARCPASRAAPAARACDRLRPLTRGPLTWVRRPPGGRGGRAGFGSCCSAERPVLVLSFVHSGGSPIPRTGALPLALGRQQQGGFR